MLSPLRFEAEPPVQPPAPNRMDVACFVGFIRLRAGASSSALDRWLTEQGWLQTTGGLRMPYARASASAYLDVPIPIERWAVFDRLFAWDERPMEGSDGFATTYLGAAVRSFFAEGGRRCYVVRAGDDWPAPSAASAESEADRAAARLARLRALVPGYPASLSASPSDRTTWHGVGHVFGLPDVSFLCCPDLPDIVRGAATPPDLRVSLPPVSEQFVECTSTDVVDDDDAAHRYHAPRSDDAGYDAWRRTVGIVRNALVAGRCETQFIATVPIPEPGSPVARDLGGVLGDDVILRATSNAARVSSFVQLVYPWAVTRGSRGLPEGMEPSEGVLTGVLARNALLNGTFHSAAGQPLGTVDAVLPAISANESGERVSLLGQTARGMEVLTDVTASETAQYRPGGIHRLISSIVRAARRVGEDAVFEASGEALWAGVRTRIEQVLLSLWNNGGLRGAKSTDAFDVRCDRSTMTQADLDAGRAVATVRVDPAAPIESITVVLALDAAGVTSLATTEAA
jgi:hypothetical protein